MNESAGEEYLWRLFSSARNERHNIRIMVYYDATDDETSRTTCKLLLKETQAGIF